MSKKGSELAIVLVVLVVAILGLIFALKTPKQSSPTGKATGEFFVPPVATVSNGDSGNLLTGHFVLPAAKAYGGGVQGVYEGNARAFSGRAYELPEQSCYKCTCMKQGITSSNKDIAARVCHDNCGGAIVSEVVGEC